MNSTTPVLRYDVSVASITAHLFEVTLTITPPSETGHVLRLPAWIPGSYMIRDFAKNIVSLTATDATGKEITAHKLDKQRWQLAPNAQPVSVTYQIYAYDLSIRSAYVTDNFAFFNGTSLFLVPEALEDQPSIVTLRQPEQAPDWLASTTLPIVDVDANGFGTFEAADFAELIDHPVLMGDLDIVPFEEQDVAFALVLAGGHQADTARIVKDLKTLCAHHFSLFDDKPPVARYQFLTLLCHDGFGGLEHRSSTALLYPRKDLPHLDEQDEMTDGYRTFLSLCSHELFHTWHVKRIRPQALKEATLAEEQYTEQLWIYEGFTSYYDDFSLLRSGIISAASYLELMAQNLTRLLRNTGRFKQTITQSSFDAWTRFYKQDEGAVNNIVSYYNKGAVLALCLDLTLRQRSDNTLSLDNVMRSLWTRYGRPDEGTLDDAIHGIVRDELGVNLNAELNNWLYSTDELPVAAMLEKFGVQYLVRPRNGLTDKGGKPAAKTAQKDFGALLKAASTGAKITQVLAGRAAEQAGLMVGDRLIAIARWQIDANSAQTVIDRCKGQAVELHVLRDHRLLTLTLPLQDAPADTVELVVEDSEKAGRWLPNLSGSV